MEKRFLQIFILLAAVFLAAGIFIFLTPDKGNTDFNRNTAQTDVSVFGSYSKGTVISINEEEIRDIGTNQSIYQSLTIKLENGEEADTFHTDLLDAAETLRYKAGESVIVGTIEQGGLKEYVIVDRYRLNRLWIVVGLFLALSMIFGKLRGITALVGLGATGAVLIYFIAPQIISGKDPFLVSMVGAGTIVLISMFVAHGFKTRIKLAALSTLLTLLIASVISYLSVSMLHLFGLGQSDAYLLQSGFLGTVDLRGVLMGGIIISVLGVLDDITTSQTAAVDELHKANPALGVKELYRRGISIGREHIVSLINTLILVYAGSSLPLFLLFIAGTSQPLWVLLNSEYMVEEIARALIGSMALIIAVPISTIFAAWYYNRASNMKNLEK